MEKNHGGGFTGRTGSIAVMFFAGTAAVFAVLAFSCAAAVENAGRVLDGSAFREKVLETWAAERGGPGDQGIEVRRVRQNTGAELLVITCRAFPALAFRARPEGSAGRKGRLALVSLEYRSPNAEGFIEWRRDLGGGGFFRDDGYAAFFALEPGLLALDITEGRIRRGDARLSGDGALRLLRDRDGRIDALTEWMVEYAAGGGPLGGPFADRKAFEALWGPVLFPELAAPGKRPAGWREAAGAEESPEPLWQRGEDIRWNRAWTRVLLPEELRPLRDSGTLLRDWEEAPEWVYYQFEWRYIIATLSGDTPFSAGAVRLVKIRH